MFHYLAEAAGREYNAYSLLLRAEGVALNKTILKDSKTGLYGVIKLIRAYTVNGEDTGVFLFNYLVFYPMPENDKTAYRIVLPIEGRLKEEKMRQSIKDLMQRLSVTDLAPEQLQVSDGKQIILEGTE